MNEDGFIPVSFGIIRVEMDKAGLAYVRFRFRDLVADAYPLAKKTCSKAGFKHDKVNAHVGPSWKLARLVRNLREAGFTPLLGTTVAYEMGRLASTHDYGSAERADARMDAVEAASGMRYRDYQREDVRWMEAAGSCILANEMRTGKTPTVLGMVPPAGAIVVCPVGVKDVWVSHVRRWLPWMEVRLNANPYDLQPGQVIVTNYEQVPMHVDVHAQMPKGCLLVADEAQALKTANSNRTIAFSILSDRVHAAQGRIILATGTPAKNGRWQEVWSLLEILKYGQRMFGNGRSFAKEWKDYYSPDEPIVGPLSRVMTRRTYKEVVGFLPPFTWTERKVYWEDLEGYDFEVRSSIDVFWDRFKDREDPLAAMRAEPNTIGEYSRLRSNLALLKSQAALEWAYEMFEAGIPCIVASMHRYPVEMVAERLEALGVRCGILLGGIGEAERAETVRAFQAGEIGVLAMTSITGGVGLDLSRGEAICLVDLSFVPGDNDQVVARLMSVANPQPKTGVRLVLAHPLEERVDAILADKSEVIRSTVGKVRSGSRTLGADVLGDLTSGDMTNGAPEGVDLGELDDMLKGLA